MGKNARARKREREIERVGKEDRERQMKTEKRFAWAMEVNSLGLSRPAAVT